MDDNFNHGAANQYSIDWSVDEQVSSAVWNWSGDQTDQSWAY